MDLANECRQKDCHLSAVLSVAEESIAGLQWKLTLPEGARAKDKRAMKWVERVLRSLPGLRKLIAYLAGARYYGYDVNEIVWRKDAGKLIPAEFAHLSHRRFGYDPQSGGFVLRDMGMPAAGEDFRAKWPNKFIVSHPRANGDAPQKEGLCRPLIWMTQFRVWTLSDWLRTAEMSWKPWRIGTYKSSNADVKDQDALETILQKLSTTGWAVKSDSMDIAIEWPGGTQSSKGTHAELSNVLCQEMSKAVLGQTETTQSSSSSGYAQAKVHDAVRRDVREAAAMQVAADLTRDLLTPLITLNFSDVVVPSFEFLTQDPVDLAAFAKAVKDLVDSKLRIPSAWVRDNAGMPEPKPGEECLNDEPEEEPDPKDPNAKKPGEKPGDGEPVDDGEDSPKPADDQTEEPGTGDGG
jgi:phage gp29-like protein